MSMVKEVKVMILCGRTHGRTEGKGLVKENV
jgi:hypothetical protein